MQLAIDGGTPVRSSLLAYGRQTIDSTDIAAVVEVLQSDWLTTGPKVQEFEQDFAKLVNADHAVAVSNGTAALHAALYAAGVQEGVEVITTPFTFVATSNAVRYMGGSVKFVDICPDTYNLNPEKVVEQITDKTKVIVAVDFAGHPADWDALNAIAREYNLITVADAAHSLGASCQGKKVGALADLTTFSLHPVKHITTGEGGVISTQRQELADKMRAFRNHGIKQDHRQRALEGSWVYDMADIGYNYRLTDIQCALGISQLKKLNAWVARRQEIAQKYHDALSHFSGLILPKCRPGCESSWHLYVVQFVAECFKVGRDKIFQAFRAENIGVNVHYIPVPWHSYYQKMGYVKGQWPVAEGVYEQAISLPMWPGMSDQDIDDVVEALRKIISTYSL